MKTTIISLTAIGMFVFYFAIISIAMLVELGMLSYIFFPAVIKRIKGT